MAETIVGFWYDRSVPFSLDDPSPYIGHLNLVLPLIADHGIQAVVMKGAERAFSEESIKAHRIDEGGRIRSRATAIERGDVRLLYNFLGHSVIDRVIPHRKTLPPVVNENPVHELSTNKLRIHQEILETLGISIPTISAKNGQEVAKFMSQYTDRQDFIAKPNDGHAGRGVRRLAWHEVLPTFSRRLEFAANRNKYLLQPAYDFTQPLPESIRPYDHEAEDSFMHWSCSVAPKEIRIYCFHSPSQTAPFPVGRTIQEGDHWFFVDPESIPAHLLRMACIATRRVAKKTNSRALYAALDVGYGSLCGSDPEWRAIELNMAYPYLINSDEFHMGVVRHLRNLLAQQIIDTIGHTSS